MIDELNTKTQPIRKEQVWSAWKRVKKGGKGMGIDHVSAEMITQNPRKYLYPLWNRLASGSYFPPAVKQVPETQCRQVYFDALTPCPAGQGAFIIPPLVK